MGVVPLRSAHWAADRLHVRRGAAGGLRVEACIEAELAGTGLVTPARSASIPVHTEDLKAERRSRSRWAATMSARRWGIHIGIIQCIY